jgi:prophage antirepressor-like protein
MATVSESGMYKLLLRSDKPEAKAFQDWVTREVLPAIRKDGER